MKRVLLIDGHNLLFRMFYGIPSSIKDDNGKEIKGVIGFIGSLKKFCGELNPYSIIVIFDSETSKTTNLNYDKNYKANRKNYSNIAENENPFSQLPYIKQALQYLEIPYFEVKNNEADDYIASIIKTKTKNDTEFIIISTDTDFFQLISTNTFLYIPKGKNSILYDTQAFIDKYNILPSDYILYKALIGDKTDNIEGIKGIGKVTATKIIYTLKNEKYLDVKIKQTLEINKERITKNIRLITLNSHINIKNVIFSKLNPKINNQKTYEIIKNTQNEQKNKIHILNQ